MPKRYEVTVNSFGGQSTIVTVQGRNQQEARKNARAKAEGIFRFPGRITVSAIKTIGR